MWLELRFEILSVNFPSRVLSKIILFNLFLRPLTELGSPPSEHSVQSLLSWLAGCLKNYIYKNRWRTCPTKICHHLSCAIIKIATFIIVLLFCLFNFVHHLASISNRTKPSAKVFASVLQVILSVTGFSCADQLIQSCVLNHFLSNSHIPRQYFPCPMSFHGQVPGNER